nr:hypothetical protein [Tanacetum cinerariifolium]
MVMETNIRTLNGRTLKIGDTKYREVKGRNTAKAIGCRGRILLAERVQPVPPYIGQFVAASVVFKGMTDQFWFTVVLRLPGGQNGIL